MNKSQSEVAAWWHNGRNFHAGLTLLSRFTKNKVFVRTLAKPGKENIPAMQEKLAYELAKRVGLDWKNMPSRQELPEVSEQKKEVNENLSLQVLPPPDKHEEDMPESYPHIIRKIKYAYSDLYKMRSLKHREMRSIPQLNSDDNVSRRAELLEQVKGLSLEMDHLYRFIKDYETSGRVPVPERVWPPEPGGQSGQLPDNAAELRKMKKTAQSANSRDNNLLLYQNKTRLKETVPMAKGPKRTRIELRIKQRNKLIEDIDARLILLQHAD